LVRHTATIEEIVQHTGFSAVETEAALTDLISEDLIERTVAGTYQIAD
jgi:DNA-binding IclR family transcriptional regulator